MCNWSRGLGWEKSLLVIIIVPFPNPYFHNLNLHHHPRHHHPHLHPHHRPHQSPHPSYEMCKWSRREWERERLRQCTHTYRQRKNFKPSMIMMICVHCTYIHVSTENSTLGAETRPGQNFQHRTLIMILLRIAAISIDFINLTAIIIITTAPHLNTKQ